MAEDRDESGVRLTIVHVVKGLPRPDFTFDYLPTPTTLFRFSALTFNGHYIHLDKEYAQKSEGYPGASRTLTYQARA